MPHRYTFHRCFHSARPAVGTDIQLAQTQLAADPTCVGVFILVDQVAAPTHHHTGIFIQMQRVCIAQNREYQVNDMSRVFQIQVLRMRPTLAI